MNPDYLSNGKYGCVFRPSVDCNKNKNKNQISKLFTTYKDMQSELTEHTRMNNEVDLYNVFTLKLIDTCDTNVSRFDITKCDNFTERQKSQLTPGHYVPQLVYEYGGDDLHKASAKIDFKQIFFGLVSIFKGLSIMDKKHYGHLDIKPDNIVYNQDAEAAALIDFGLSRDVTNFYQKDDNLFLIEFPYPYYPPEFGFMKDFYDFGADGMIEKMNKRDYNFQNTEKFIDVINVMTSIKTKNVEMKMLLHSFKNPIFSELVSLFKYIVSEKAEHVMDTFVNRIDVFMLGSTIAEVLSSSIAHKKTTIDNENIYFYIEVIKLIHNMTHVSPVKRYTPQQALSEYKRIVATERRKDDEKKAESKNSRKSKKKNTHSS
jgi:serine/threonine protein kinase